LTRFPIFPALYLASDKDTALSETLGQGEDREGLSRLELALTKPESITIVCVRGELDQVIDLNEETNLVGFCNLIKDFTISKGLEDMASQLKLIPPRTAIRTVDELLNAILQPKWNQDPTWYDIPAPSQIFGQICDSAGIQGILYPSQFTKKPCLAIFPRSFEKSSSYVEITDDPPLPSVPARLDSTNWKAFV
jgi:hypothetical protein